MPVATSNQWTVFVTLKGGAAPLVAIYDTESEALSAHTELLEALESANKNNLSVVSFGGGRNALDVAAYNNSSVLPAGKTPGVMIPS